MRYIIFKVGQFFVKPIKTCQTEREAMEFAETNRYYVIYDTEEHGILRNLREINKEHTLHALGSDSEVRIFEEHCRLEAECDQARIQRYLKKHQVNPAFL